MIGSLFHGPTASTDRLYSILSLDEPLATPINTFFTAPEQVTDFPAFSKADQNLREFHQAGMSDPFGNPTHEYAIKQFPIISSRNPNYGKLFRSLKEFIYKIKSVDCPFGTIEFNLIGLINSTSRTTQSGIYGLHFIGSNAFKHLEEVIHSSILEILTAINTERLEEMFQGVEHKFEAICNDSDCRVISAGGIELQASKSRATIHFLSKKLHDFNREACTEKLKVIYPNVEFTTTKEIKFEAVKNLGGINKYHLVSDPANPFTIVGINLIGEPPLEIIFAGMTEQGYVTLKKDYLSSSNCWGISLLPIITSAPEQEVCLTITTGPFGPAKALIDLLCNISTDYNPDVESLIRFWRDGIRSTQPNLEKWRVNCVFDPSYKEQFLKAKENTRRRKFQFTGSPKDPSVPRSNAYYIYSLLKKEIKKSTIDPKTKVVNSPAVVTFVFRACQSLSRYSPLTDEELSEIWQLMEKHHLLSGDQSDPLNLALKEALVDHKIPFTAASSWLSLLSWVYDPTTFSHHDRQPAFISRFLLPVDPVQSMHAVHSHLHLHPNSIEPFKKISVAFAAKKTPQIPSPLGPYLKLLNINAHALAKFTEKWIAHTNPLISHIGAQLSLSLFYSRSHLDHVFRHLPKVLEGAIHPSHNSVILEGLKTTCERDQLPVHLDALQQIDALQSPLTIDAWLHVLAQTKSKDVFSVMYEIWRQQDKKLRTTNPPIPLEMQNFAERSLEMFEGLCKIDPFAALSFQTQLIRRNILNQEQEVKCFMLLCHVLQRPRYAGAIPHWQLDELIQLGYHLFEHHEQLDLKTEKQKKFFSDSLDFFIRSLIQIPHLANTGDYFLIESSRRGYLESPTQVNRWVDRIGQLSVSQAPHAPVTAALFYKLVKDEQLVELTPEDGKRWQLLRINLGRRFVQDRNQAKSDPLLEELFNETIEDESQRPFYHYLSEIFKLPLPEQKLPECSLEWLESLLTMTPPEHVENAANLLCGYCDQMNTRLNSLPKERWNELPLGAFEALLNKPNIKTLCETQTRLTSSIILYLKTVSSEVPQERMPTLWNLFDHIRQQHPKRQDILRMLQGISSMLIQGTTPPPTLLEWIGSKQEGILKVLQNAENWEESGIVLSKLEKHSISHPETARYVWLQCRHHLTHSQSPLPPILTLLEKQTPDSISPYISENDHASIQKLHELVVNSYEYLDPHQTSLWTNYFISILHPTQHYENCALQTLNTVNRLLENQNRASAFTLIQTLRSIPESHTILARNAWREMLDYPQVPVSIHEGRFLLLSPQAIPLFGVYPVALSRYAQSHLDQLLVKPCTSDELIYCFDLMTAYDLHDGKVWLSLWNHLNVVKDEDLIRDCWDAFRFHWPTIEFPLAAQVWTQALICLHGIQSELLTDYVDFPEELETIYDSLEAQSFKWPAYKAIFEHAIRIATNNKDVNRLKSIFEMKQQILISHLKTSEQPAESKEEDCSTLYLPSFVMPKMDCLPPLNLCRTQINPAVAQWNREIDLALIEALQQTGKKNPATFYQFTYCIIYAHLQAAIDDNAPADQLDIGLKDYLKKYFQYNGETRRSKLNNEILVGTMALMRCAHELSHTRGMNFITPFMYLKPVDIIAKDGNPDRLMDCLSMLAEILKDFSDKNASFDLSPMHTSFGRLIENVLRTQENPTLATVEQALVCLERGIPFYRLQKLKIKRIHQQIVLKLLHADYLDSKSAPPPSIKILKSHEVETEEDDHDVSDPYSSKCLELLQDNPSLILPVFESLKKGVKLAKNKWIVSSCTKTTVIDILLKLLNPDKNIGLSQGEQLRIIKKMVEVYMYSPPQHMSVPKGTPACYLVDLLPITFLSKAHQWGVFKDKHALLFEYVHCLGGPTLVPAIKFSLTQQQQHQIILKVIDRFLALERSFGVYISMHKLNTIQSQTPLQRCKPLIPYHERIYRAAESHPTASVPGQSTMMYFMYESTNPSQKLTELADDNLIQIKKLQYLSSFAIYQKLVEKKGPAYLQAHYMMLCLKLLKDLYQMGTFAQNHSTYLEYLNKLREIMPCMIQCELNLSFTQQESQGIKVLKPTKLIKRFSKLTIPNLDGAAQFTSAQKKDLIQRHRTILFDLIDRLLKDPVNIYQRRNASNCLLMVLASVLPTDDYFNADQKDAVGVFEASIKYLAPRLNPIQILDMKLLQIKFYMNQEQKKEELFFARFKDTCQHLVEHAPPNSPIGFYHDFYTRLLGIIKNSENTHQEKLFVQLFQSMRIALSKVSEELQDVARNQLAAYLSEGIEQGWLKAENPDTRSEFNLAKEWIQMNPQLVLCTKEIELKLNRGEHENCLDEYHQELRSLMPQVIAQIIVENNLEHSRNMLTLAEHLPPQAKRSLYSDWMAILIGLYSDLQNAELEPHLKSIQQKIDEIELPNGCVT